VSGFDRGPTVEAVLVGPDRPGLKYWQSVGGAVSEYVVDIKPSARRANGVVGSVVHRRGPVRRFEAREDAEAWAAGLSERGGRTVWIRTANPDDRSEADAYLVSRRPARGADATPTGSEAGADEVATGDPAREGDGPLGAATRDADADASSADRV
jgi:hypothetical protein